MFPAGQGAVSAYTTRPGHGGRGGGRAATADLRKTAWDNANSQHVAQSAARRRSVVEAIGQGGRPGVGGCGPTLREVLRTEGSRRRSAVEKTDGTPLYQWGNLLFYVTKLSHIENRPSTEFKDRR